MFLDMTVCDVEHGDCVFFKFPSGKNTLIDCGGANDKSASTYLKALKVQKLDYLSISHPHIDHIRDIVNLDSTFHPVVLGRNKIFTREKIINENEEVFETHKDIIEKYLEMNTDYNAPVEGDSDKDPTMTEWGSGANVISYWNTDSNMGLNDLSRVVFIPYGNHQILHAGDLEEQGWKKLLEDQNFVRRIKKTTVFIASHHGRDTGFCSEIFQHFTPKITIISDGRFGDTSATDRYYNVTSGMEIKKVGKEELEERRVLTTRKDGLINVMISDGKKLSIITTK